MAATSSTSPSLFGPLIAWAIVHALAAVGMFSHTDGTPLVVGDMEYRWFFAVIYGVAGLVPLASLIRERQLKIPVTPTHTMAIAFGLYVFLVGSQIGLLPIDDVRLITGAWAAIGGGACFIVFNRRLYRVRQIQAQLDEDALVRRIAAAVRAELQA